MINLPTFEETEIRLKNLVNIELIKAIKKNDYFNEDRLKRLIEVGADLDQQDKRFNITLLMEICYYHKSPKNLVKIFLENGANANAVDKWGRDALDYAKRARYPHSKQEMIDLENLFKSYKK